MTCRLLVLLVLLVLPACLTQPSDQEQIRALARRTVSAISREDWGTAYRQTDLDYRATCTREQFVQAMMARWPESRPLRLVALDGLTVRHIHAGAALVLESGDGGARVPVTFIRDGGRWYLYEPEC